MVIAISRKTVSGLGGLALHCCCLLTELSTAHDCIVLLATYPRATNKLSEAIVLSRLAIHKLNSWATLNSASG